MGLILFLRNWLISWWSSAIDNRPGSNKEEILQEENIQGEKNDSDNNNSDVTDDKQSEDKYDNFDLKQFFRNINFYFNDSETIKHSSSQLWKKIYV